MLFIKIKKNWRKINSKIKYSKKGVLRLEHFCRYSRDLDDNEMDEDEDYDSDLDGFIDDSEMLDDFNQQDFEETLRFDIYILVNFI